MQSSEIYEGVADPVGVAPGKAPQEPASSGSLADLIKEDLAELEAIQFVLIKVPGYDRSGLQVKYYMPTDGKVLTDIGDRCQKDFKDTYHQNLYSAIDTMIKLCDGLYAMVDGNDEPTPVDPDESGEPVRFDQRLAEMMGWPVETARAAVRRLFKQNEFAILDHAARLNRWLADTKADVSRSFWQGE